MNRQLMSVVFLAVGLVLAAVVVSQHRQIGELNAQLATAQQKSSAQLAPKPTQQASKPAKLASEAAPDAAPVKTSAVVTVSAAAQVKNTFAAGLASMMKNPQMQEMIRAQQKMMIDQMYGSLAKALNLPAGQQDALNKLLLDRQMAMAEAGVSAMSASAADQKQVADVIKSIKSDFDTEVQHLLNPQDYQAFQDYEKTTPERAPLQMFKGTLSGADVLTDQQETALVTAMSEERRALPPTSMINSQVPGPQQFSEERVAETLKQLDQLQQRNVTRAATILTPAQLDQFVKYQSQQRSMQEMGMKMAAQMFSTKGAAPAQ
jgi:hypothetical protein